MGFRFYRRLPLLPGLRVNLSKSGASLSVGGRGAWYTIGPRGQRATLGLPGTGRNAFRRPHGGHRLAFALAVVAMLALIWLRRQIAHKRPRVGSATSFALRGGKAGACDGVTNSAVRWCLTTP